MDNLELLTQPSVRNTALERLKRIIIDTKLQQQRRNRDKLELAEDPESLFITHFFLKNELTKGVQEALGGRSLSRGEELKIATEADTILNTLHNLHSREVLAFQQNVSQAQIGDMAETLAMRVLVRIKIVTDDLVSSIKETNHQKLANKRPSVSMV